MGWYVMLVTASETRMMNDPSRYQEANQTELLTPQERHEGWHFCLELDGALSNPIDYPCHCEPNHPVHLALKCRARSQTKVEFVL